MPLWTDHNPFRVLSSSIHGKGVFAKQDLERGWWFAVPNWEVPDRKPTLDEEGNEEEVEESEYSLACGGRKYEFYNPYRFLNHSRYPNAKLRGAQGHFELELLEFVVRGQEITVDYN